MRNSLSTTLALAAALTLSLPGSSWAKHHRAKTPKPYASDQSADQSTAPEPVWGVGFGYLPSTNGALDALSATYRLNPDLDLDGLLLAGAGSTYNGGTNSAGQPVDDSNSSFGIGAQGRYSLLHPTSFLALQAVGRLSYVTASAAQTHLGNTITTTGGQFGVFAGVGFEGFVPAWPAVSIEVNSGLNIMLSDISVAGFNQGQSAVYLGASNTNAFVPFNLAVHYYF
jgi:hypothetical protein